MKRDHVSFDVFDTCLIRRCGLPCKIWDLMADKLFDEDDDRGRLSFVGNRSLVEKMANQRMPHPVLSDIYDELNVAQWGFEKERVMNLEMEIEEQELFPNPEMLKIVKDYREKGFIIAFISDMYLPTKFIKKILVKFGFCNENENVFVSAECKAVKSDGKLFDYVLKKTETKAKQWIHYGDNERSDYRIPKSKGIKANLVNNTSFTDEEKRWIDEARFYTHKHEIELWAGLCRLTRLQNEQSFAATMAVDFIASVYVPYVIWVLRTAKAKGIKTLYFLARDSHIFLEIAQALKAESEGIECRYLKVSRRVLHACAFYDVDDYEMKLTVGNAYNQTVERVLEKMGLRYECLSKETSSKFSRSYSLINEKRMKLFSKSLMENDSEYIKSASQENRTLFLEYLKQECFFNQKSAMVDLGWVGSCRCIVNHILQKEGYQPVPTFYWGYHRWLSNGKSADGLYVYNQQCDISQLCSCGSLFFEEYASLNSSGSTVGYQKNNGMISAVEGERKSSAAYLEKINEKITVSIVDGLLRNGLLDKERALKDVFLLCGLKQFSNMIKKPSKKIIDVFKDVYTESYGVSEKFIRVLPVKDFFALLIWGVPATSIWAEGSILSTFGPLSSLFIKIYKKTSKSSIANHIKNWHESK